MKKSSWFAVILIVVLCAGLMVAKSLGRPPLSDEDQIHSLLVKGQTAVEKKDLKSAMQCVSRNYKDPGGIKFEQLRVQAIQAFQQEGKYNVVLDRTSVKLEGEQATVHSTVTLGMVSHGSMHPLFSRPITIHVAKESSMHWLFIPAKSWRITSIEGAPIDAGE
jgi:CxxC motif-containing protein (DUF1111 family)